jgi:hypothetical protein
MAPPSVSITMRHGRFSRRYVAVAPSADSDGGACTVER